MTPAALTSVRPPPPNPPEISECGGSRRERTTGKSRRRMIASWCRCNVCEQELHNTIGDEEALHAEEEADPTKSPPTPVMPTQSEVEEHRISHIPFRCWCPECVEAMGREDPHRTIDHERRKVPTIAIDYMFLTYKGVKLADEMGEIAGDELEGCQKVLVVRDLKSKSLFAHCVERKGPDDAGYIVDAIVADVLWTGHSRVILKSDNEPSIVAVAEEVKRRLRIEKLELVAGENSIPYDSQSNGGVEVGCGI